MTTVTIHVVYVDRLRGDRVNPLQNRSSVLIKLIDTGEEVRVSFYKKRVTHAEARRSHWNETNVSLYPSRPASHPFFRVSYPVRPYRALLKGHVCRLGFFLRRF